MKEPLDLQNYYKLTISLLNLQSGPLKNEEVTFTGEKRNKSFKGTTNGLGQLTVYLPKGDVYGMHFKHNKNYDSYNVEYKKGFAKGNMELMYIGTEEIEKRMILNIKLKKRVSF